MGKWKIIGLVVLVLIVVSLYYYFFIHAPNVRTQEFFKMLDDYVESLESFAGQTVDSPNLNYYRYACQFDYETTSEEDIVVLKNVNCDWNKVRELLSQAPEDNIIQQKLYLSLSNRNSMRTVIKSFSERVKNIHSQKGLSPGAGAEMLSYRVLLSVSGPAYAHGSNMLTACHQKYNNTLRCFNIITEAGSKASEDLLKEIDLGENFISECTRSSILSTAQLPPEISGISLNRENCGRLAEIYQWVFDDVKDKEMDANGKFVILNTFYLITKSFKGYGTEVTSEFTNIMKKHIDPEFSDVFGGV